MAKPTTLSAKHLDPSGRTSSSMRSPFLGSSFGFQPQNPSSEGLLTEEPSFSSLWIYLPSQHISCSCISPSSSAGEMTLIFTHKLSWTTFPGQSVPQSACVTVVQWTSTSPPASPWQHPCCASTPPRCRLQKTFAKGPNQPTFPPGRT